jgi:hypothetical protein
MPICKPFHRNWRALKQGVNSGYSSWAYILDPDYARDPLHYVRAYLLIQRDLERLFEYVEPSEEALCTFSFRTHELLMRTCIEVEANFKAILAENVYVPRKDTRDRDILNISIYNKIELTHHLSSYEVILPMWNGPRRAWKPFDIWGADRSQSPSWYGAYNASKHDRHNDFKQANLQNLLGAVTGLLVLLSSQFGREDFSAGNSALTVTDSPYEFEAALGQLFRIHFPDDWSDDEVYDFDWATLQYEPVKFGRIDYNQI